MYAHTREGRPTSEWHSLRDHLEEVAELASGFAARFDASDWAWLAGLWHDLGKHRTEFQQYLAGHRDSGGDHAVIGAVLAQSKGRGNDLWVALAAAIAGHHAGLANLEREEGPRALLARLRLEPSVVAACLAAAPPDLVSHPLPSPPQWLDPTTPEARADTGSFRRKVDLWTRFLFSALVDADFLDTERFKRGDRRKAMPSRPPMAELARRLDGHVDQLAATAQDTEVNRVRAEVLAACRQMADAAPGLFSLSVPTGGGKTLAGMSFALRHASRNALDRVIAVIPFTSIIEQNVEVYRRALGHDQVLEHHSNLDPERETWANQRASENWDLPIVVTTAVQFFESLFANRSSRCRKLHNVAGSVVLLDEAQTIPPGFLAPVLDVLGELVTHYGCTVVLSTATQPALTRRGTLPQGFEEVIEIAPEPASLARRLVRFKVEWPSSTGKPVQWPDLARLLGAHEQVLAIVHRRQDARDLFGLLPAGGRFHLSAWMCAAHRKHVLERIKAALRSGEMCRVVATQLVEAGVDIDFPWVYRALAGLDSLVQAGGRCNREGGPVPGHLVVFRAPTEPPRGTPLKGSQVATTMLHKGRGTVDLANPERIETYFRRLYQSEELDRRGVQPEREALNFATVDRLVRWIDDTQGRPVVVPWGEAPQRLDRLRSEGPSRKTLRSLQPFVVSVPPPLLDSLDAAGGLELVQETVHTLAKGFHDLYHQELGLVIDEPPTARPEDLII